MGRMPKCRWRQDAGKRPSRDTCTSLYGVSSDWRGREPGEGSRARVSVDAVRLDFGEREAAHALCERDVALQQLDRVSQDMRRLGKQRVGALVLFVLVAV